MGRWLEKEIKWCKSRIMLVAFILGQFIAFLNASTSISSYEVAIRGINAPTSQSFLNYALLAVIYGAVLLSKRKTLQAKWYYYILLGLVDVEANYLVVKAFQYTSMTSIMLLLCWSIPCVVFLTWIFLKARYGWLQITGAVICIGGLVVIVYSDVHTTDRAKGSNPLKGDLFVLGGALLYAVSNVTEEFFVKSANRLEVMAMLGTFGAVVSLIQISILERRELSSIHWHARVALPFFGYAVAMFLLYSLVPILLKISGSTMLNLSLLTSDAWAVLIRVFVYHQKVDWMYFLAFSLIVVGIVVFSWASRNKHKIETGTEENNSQLNPRDEEHGRQNPYRYAQKQNASTSKS